MTLGRNIGVSIFNMGLQRAMDFVSVLVVTALVVRSLSRQEYGMLSLVMSYGLIFNMLNVSVSAILIRDYQKLKGRMDEYMQAFLLFSFIKSGLALLLCAVIGCFLYRHYHSVAMLLVLLLTTVTTVLLYVTEPLSVLLSVRFQQPALTKINLVASLANMLLSAGALLVPTALFVSAKNAVVSLIVLALTVAYAGFRFRLAGGSVVPGRLCLVKECFVGFSVWSHLSGIMTDIIYRADLLILGWLGTPFRTMGNYNVALQMANFAKLLPQILQYNCSLGLSHREDPRQQDEMTFLFIKYSFLLSLATMAGYGLFGRWGIQLIAGSDVDHIYALGFYMVGGLCAFNTFRSFISYGSVVHDIRECFLFAMVPSTVVALIGYGVMGYRWGADGMAKANLVAGLAMSFFVLLYVHTRTPFRWRFALVTDTERALFAYVWRKISAFGQGT